MPSSILLKTSGLGTSANQLSKPPGSLDVASNVVISRDNTIEQRRGFRLYDQTFGVPTDTAKQLRTYQNRIIRHYQNTLSYDTGVLDSTNRSVFNDFSGSYTEPQTGTKIKSVAASGNFYFTSNNGVQKISASSASGLSASAGYITQAGGVKAIDLKSRLSISPGSLTGFFTQDSAVAYRHVWVTKDANTNAIAGTPSQRTEIYNPLSNLLLVDYMRLLGALDDAGSLSVSANSNVAGYLIDNKDYVSSLKLASTATMTSLTNNLIALATKIDKDIVYAADPAAPAPYTNGAMLINAVSFPTATTLRITFNIDPTAFFSKGSNITLQGFTVSAGTGIINTNYSVIAVSGGTLSIDVVIPSTITGVTYVGASIIGNEYRSLVQPSFPGITPTNAQLVAIQTYINLIMKRLQVEPFGTIIAAQATLYITPLGVTGSTNTILDITIPQAVNSNYYLQIYRSSQVTATGTTILAGLTPSDEMQQVYEAYPTAAELAAGVMTVIDIVGDSFRGAFLYTNPQTGQGILQANDIPPYCLDVARFKNVIFYANTKTKYRLNINVLGISNMIADYTAGTTPAVVLTDTVKTNTYNFVNGRAQVVTLICDAASTLVATTAPASFFRIYNANNEIQYYVWYAVDLGTMTDPAAGGTGIRVNVNSVDNASTVASKTAAAISRQLLDFSAIQQSGTLAVITNVNVGYTNAPDIGSLPVTFSIAQTFSGRGERITYKTSNLAMPAGGTLNTSGSGNYFTMNGAFNRALYYVWYQIGTSVDPALAGRTGIKVTLTGGETSIGVANATFAAINSAAPTVFSATGLTSSVILANVNPGPAANPAVGTMPGGFSVSVTQAGALDVLLSSQVSPSRAVDETTRSFIRIINKNKADALYAFYLSGAGDTPGKFLLESRNLNNLPFYVLGNNTNTGASFSPNISPNGNTLTAIATGNPSTITTTTAHGLVNNDGVVLVNSNSVPNVDGVATVTYVAATQFSIPTNVLTSGSAGAFVKLSNAVVGQNEVKPQRIYYSKVLQPEAVPIVNYMDVGSENKAILRIFPLRDSLFVFKEDGLWRISGEQAPFNIALFDSSYILIAPDSLDVSNNVLYGWTRQGITAASESGTQNISRDIDVDILKLGSSNYPNFASATWGIGYESDNSYVVYTVSNTTDTKPTIAYRYSSLTKSWTTWNKTNTCGVIHPADDKLYMGAGDVNSIEQERKSFTRIDYADREILGNLAPTNYLNGGSQLKLTNVLNMSVGDVVTQDQLVTVYSYNQLLKKLDGDVGLGLKNYYSTLLSVGGDDMRTKLADTTIGLAPKLDVDPNLSVHNYAATIASVTGSIAAASIATSSVITTSAPHGLKTGRWVAITGNNALPSISGNYQITVIDATNFSIAAAVTSAGGASGTFATLDADFRDVQACYNLIVANLNSAAEPTYKNYAPIASTTTQEAIITAVDPVLNTITLNTKLDYVVGPLTVFNAIPTTFTYSANTLDAIQGFKNFNPPVYGDPLGVKHLREATLMFISMAFTSATMSFATDLMPAFYDVPFNGEGNGIFGSQKFGTTFFGGGGNSVPFRTFIPRDYQRCKYIIIKFTHQIAREKWAILGVTVTGEMSTSTRGYR